MFYLQVKQKCGGPKKQQEEVTCDQEFKEWLHHLGLCWQEIIRLHYPE